MIEAVGEDEVVGAGQRGEAVLGHVLVGEGELRRSGSRAGAQERGEEGRGGAGEGGHGDLSGGLSRVVGESVPGAGEGALDLDRGVGEDAPRLGQHDAPARALGERERHRALEQAQLLRDRRGGDAQGLGDGADAAQLSEFAQNP